MLAEVESRFDRPVDVEWAFAGGKFHLLQARPITAYYPLPKSMQTRTGEAKRLYLDGTLTKLGMNVPLSILGLDYIDTFGSVLLQELAGTNLYDLERGFYFPANGHDYVNLSNFLRLVGKEKAIQACRTVDSVSADILAEIDEREYRAPRFPAALKRLGLLRVLLVAPRILWNLVRAMRGPDQYRERLEASTAAMERDMAAEMQHAATLREACRGGTRAFGRYFFGRELPAVGAAQWARRNIDRIFRRAGDEIRRRAGLLERAVPRNCTIEMGLAMFGLSRFDEVRDAPSAEDLAARLKTRSFSPAFLTAWDEYMARFGHRCPGELDPATPRYAERPERFFAQLRAMALNTSQTTDPEAVFRRGMAEREESYRILLEEARQLGRGREKSLRANYRVLVALKGYRELPKSQIVRMTSLFRERALAAARIFCYAGRMDRLEDIFDLTIAQVDAGLRDSSIDLRDLLRRNVDARRGFHVYEYPRVIDSRGRILRPRPKPAGDAVFVGEPISPGVARGRVKVLKDPDEKPVLPGDILVARTTDPGWTPLFLNASAIVLEVGGLLQHGAVVAREYCKPCVAGIENAHNLFQDGTWVEVDGTQGTVRLIDGL
jgi:pyruvate,water dikinase